MNREDALQSKYQKDLQAREMYQSKKKKIMKSTRSAFEKKQELKKLAQATLKKGSFYENFGTNIETTNTKTIDEKRKQITNDIRELKREIIRLKYDMIYDFANSEISNLESRFNKLTDEYNAKDSELKKIVLSLQRENDALRDIKKQNENKIKVLLDELNDLKIQNRQEEYVQTMAKKLIPLRKKIFLETKSNLELLKEDDSSVYRLHEHRE